MNPLSRKELLGSEETEGLELYGLDPERPWTFEHFSIGCRDLDNVPWW